MSAVPAWKRLGLKLKGASSDGSPVSAASQTTVSSAPPAARQQHHHHHPQANPTANGGNQYGTPGLNKRKQVGSGSYPISDSKRPRWEESSNLTPSGKSVAFSEDTKKAAPKKPKKKKGPKQQAQKQPFDFTPVLKYLRTWLGARDHWKFNKNHQTLLIKHLYNSDAIPSSDIDTFYLYIRDIKGASRKRLIEEAEEVRKKDMDAGPKGFPEGTKAPEEKQKQYEEILADLLKRQAEIKETRPSAAGLGKRGFEEVEFVLRAVDKEVQQRVVKRMRAETVIDELESSDSEEAAADMSTLTSTNAASSRVIVPVTNGGADAQKQKAKRRKKLRTADVDSSSDSDSDSDSDSSDSDSDSDDTAAGDEDGGSGSSSSSSGSDSDSDSDSDEEMEGANGVDEDESSSSSSSSSESGSDSESEGSVAGAAIAEDDDSGSDGDSESSDSDSDS